MICLAPFVLGFLFLYFCVLCSLALGRSLSCSMTIDGEFPPFALSTVLSKTIVIIIPTTILYNTLSDAPALWCARVQGSGFRVQG